MVKTVSEALSHLPDKIILSQIVVPPQGQRKDLVNNMDTAEGRHAFWTGLQQENVPSLNPHDESIIVCPVYSPHTNGRVVSADHELDFVHRGDTPAHYNVWSQNLTAEITPKGLNKNTVRSLASGVSAVYWHLYNNTKIHPVIFQLFGYTPKDNQLGQSAGPPSDPFNHLHIAYPPVPSSNDRVEPSPAQILKFYSPVSLLFADLFEPISAQISENIKSAGKIDVSSVHEPNNPYGVGVSIRIANSTRLNDYLEIGYQLVGTLNQGYQILLQSHQQLWCSRESAHPQIITSAVAQLRELGISQELALELFNRSQVFRPTLIQVSSWLEKGGLDDEATAKLIKLKNKYEQTKVRLGKLDPSASPKIAVLHKLLTDQIRSPNEDRPVATLPANIPLKMVCHTYSRGGKLVIPQLNISLLLISSGNTAEVLGNTLITRR